MARVLSVSYDASLLRTRKMLLEYRGYSVLSAEGFNNAIEKCKSEKYDLLIVGHSIPPEDKQAVVGEFRRHCDAPVLALLRVGEPPLCEATESIEPHPELVLAAVERMLKQPAKGVAGH